VVTRIPRRAFMAAVPFALLGWAAPFRLPWLRHAQPATHPDPRPGVDARDVLTAEQLQGFGDDVIAVFDMVREMPQIADGIHCYCGCATMPGFRSLLVCYEQEGMARGCHICQGEARLAHRRWKEGQSLDQIRRAIDARYA
jgi:hypothetical protein